MTRPLLLLVLCFILLAFTAREAREILQRAEDAIKGKTSHAIIEMRVQRPEFTRRLYHGKLVGWQPESTPRDSKARPGSRQQNPEGRQQDVELPAQHGDSH